MRQPHHSGNDPAGAVLVTGGTGFVGRSIVQVLQRRGETVVVLAPSPSLVKGVLAVIGDVRSADDLGRAFEAAAVDRVIHAAALTPDAAMEAERPEEIVSVNIGGTVPLMQAARRAGVRRVIGLSSAAVYGSAVAAGGWLTEDAAPCQPTGLYGTTKWAAERIVLRLGALHAIEAAAVRLGGCFGVNEHPTGVRPMLSPHWQCAEAARTGQECVLPRPMWADWVDATEAAAAIVSLLDLPHLPATALNLGGGVVTSVQAWCEALVAAVPDFRWRIDASMPTVRYGMERDRSPLDMTRLQAALGTVPRTDGLIDRACRFLAWRGGEEGVALCGP